MHGGRLKMRFIYSRGFKRNYVCTECGVRCGIEKRSHGKVPFCCGTHHEFQIKKQGRILYTPIPSNCIYREPAREPINRQTAVATFGC